MIHQSARTQDETIETVLGVQLLDLVEKTGNYVVSARSLTTRQDDTNVHLLGVGLSSRLKLYDRHTIGIGEQLLNLFLITYTLGSLTLLDFHSTLKSLRQLGLISGSRNLQCTFFHNLFIVF